MFTPAHPHRAIRSYVRRSGRMTEAQRRALRELWPRYGVERTDAPLDLLGLFGRSAPVVVEIGFGNGEALVAEAGAHPERNYLGIEMHRPGIGRLMNALDQTGANNVRIMEGDAKEIFARCIGGGALAAVHVFFPDPWPKKRHFKRRLLQADFIRELARVLASGGYVHVATDWGHYAEAMLAAFEAEAVFENSAGPGRYAERPNARPMTKFECRGRSLGHRVYDLSFRRCDRRMAASSAGGAA